MAGQDLQVLGEWLHIETRDGGPRNQVHLGGRESAGLNAVPSGENVYRKVLPVEAEFSITVTLDRPLSETARSTNVVWRRRRRCWEEKEEEGQEVVVEAP